MANARLNALRSALKSLAMPLFWMLFSSTSGSVLIWQGWQHQQAAEASHAAALQTLGQIRRQLASGMQQQQDMADFAAPYRAMTAQDRFAPEHRLDWRDAMENLRQRKIVPQLGYRIFPQSGNNPSGIPWWKTADSEMKLHFGLAHEEQLLDFFDALSAENSGWFQLESCTLQRNAAQDADILLRGECNGRWITLDRIAAP